MIPHTLNEIESRWRHTPSYHMIDTGIALRELYFQRFTQAFLDEHEMHMYVVDAVLRTGYIETALISKKGKFYLKNIGYTESPMWELSGHGIRGNWLRIEFEDSEDLQRQIEAKIGETHEYTKTTDSNDINLPRAIRRDRTYD